MSKGFRRAAFVFGIGAAVLVALWLFPPVPYRQAEETEIRVALIRNILQPWGHSRIADLTVDGGAPSKALIVRLTDLHPIVRSGAHHIEGTDGTGIGTYVDEATREPVVLCDVGAIHWLNATTVEVDASCSEGLLGGSGGTYLLNRTLSGWAVAKTSNQWVS